TLYLHDALPIFEPFEDGNHRQEKAHRKHIKRNVTFGVSEGFVSVQNQILHRPEYPERENACNHRSDYPTTYDAPDFTPLHCVKGYAYGSKANNGSND